MPIQRSSQDEAAALRQRFGGHETATKTDKAPSDAALQPNLLHGAGGGAAGAIASALAQWSDGDSKPSSSDVAKEEPARAKVTGNNLQAGASLEMTPVNAPLTALNPLAQSAVLQGAQPIQLFGTGGSIARGGAQDGQQTAGQDGQSSDIHWTEGNLPENLDQRVAGYGIQTVVNPDGTIVVMSDNIQVSVQSLGPEFDAMFEGKSEAEINAMLAEWRERKAADDTLAYGEGGTDALREQAIESEYYGSEQHVVWAYSASARTGGRIPPEFFLEFDPFGGTAGNGPEIINPGDWAGGGAGGMLSTIAMGHDTDWGLGRYMGIGPLDELHDLNPTNQAQMKLMGAVGLMSPELALPTAWSALPPEIQAQLLGGTAGGGLLGGVLGAAGGYGLSVEALRNNPEYAPFMNALDVNTSGDSFYTTGNAAWDVNYSWDYIAQNTNADDLWFGAGQAMTSNYQFTPQCRDPNAPRRNDLDDLIQEHSPGHRPDDERESG